MKKTKTTRRMNNVIQLEDRASSSRSKHEGESSSSLCDRLSRTRDFSQRQLPTDHDYAVPTREYQTDQSSLQGTRERIVAAGCRCHRALEQRTLAGHVLKAKRRTAIRAIAQQAPAFPSRRSTRATMLLRPSLGCRGSSRSRAASSR